MDKLRLALGIISERITELDWREYDTLGYDTDRFGAFGEPDWNSVKEKAEDILWCTIYGKATNRE